MTFINKKEEVIDLKLTQFGKELLSRGAFQPKYYAFFDDDVIYDGKYGGISEGQNDIQSRIKDAIRLKTSHSTMGVETRFDEETEKIKEGERNLFIDLKREQNRIEKQKLLQCKLSNGIIGMQQLPYFEMGLLDAQAESHSFTEGLTTGLYNAIPKFTVSPSYNIIVDRQDQRDPSNASVDEETFIDFSSDSVVFLDNSKLIKNEESLTIQLEEFNTPFNSVNFSIEIFKIVEENDKETLVPIEPGEELESLFDIYVDSEVKLGGTSASDPSANLRNRNLYPQSSGE